MWPERACAHCLAPECGRSGDARVLVWTLLTDLLLAMAMAMAGRQHMAMAMTMAGRQHMAMAMAMAGRQHVSYLLSICYLFANLFANLFAILKLLFAIPFLDFSKRYTS